MFIDNLNKGVNYDRMYHCGDRRIYWSGLQISDRSDPTKRRMCISNKNFYHKCGRLFSHRHDSGVGRENKLAESQSRTVPESWDLRRIYDIFIFCTGNRRFNRRWENEYRSALCGIECGGRSHRSICRTGNYQKDMIKHQGHIIYWADAVTFRQPCHSDSTINVSSCPKQMSVDHLHRCNRGLVVFLYGSIAILDRRIITDAVHDLHPFRYMPKSSIISVQEQTILMDNEKL